MPTKQRCYTGKLAKPIVWTDPPAFWGAVTEERVRKYCRDYENRQRQAEQRVNQKLLQKMSLLIKHFKITKEGDAAALAWALALKHVPGFKIIHQQKSKKGRKRKWDGQQLEDLLETVRSVKKRFGLTDRQALKFMVNNQQYARIWGPPSNHKGSKQQWIETLESRLQDAKRIEKAAKSASEDLLRIMQSPEKFRK